MRKNDEGHWWFLGMGEIMESVLNIFMNNREDSKILDVGCGTGWFSKKLLKYGNVWALDMEEIALDICRERGINNLVNADAAAVPFPDKTFDLIVCAEVLYHQFVDSDATVLKEFYRLLKPGGIVLVTVPAHSYLFGPNDKVNLTRRRYSKRQLESLFKTAGFKIRLISFFNFFLYPVAIAKKILEIFFPQKNKSAIRTTPAVLNLFLFNLLKIEAFMIVRFGLPQGISLICVGEK